MSVLVELERDFFGPGGVLFEVRNNPVTLPDEFGERDKAGKYTKLPKGARVVGEDQVVTIERKTADGTIVLEDQVIGGDTDIGDLDGKAGDPENVPEQQLPTFTAKTPSPQLKPEKK